MRRLLAFILLAGVVAAVAGALVAARSSPGGRRDTATDELPRLSRLVDDTGAAIAGGQPVQRVRDTAPVACPHGDGSPGTVRVPYSVSFARPSGADVEMLFGAATEHWRAHGLSVHEPVDPSVPGDPALVAGKDGHSVMLFVTGARVWIDGTTPCLPPAGRTAADGDTNAADARACRAGRYFAHVTRAAHALAPKAHERQLAAQSRWRETLRELGHVLPPGEARDATRTLLTASTLVSDRPWSPGQLAAADTLARHLHENCGITIG